jgi:hypothetical protein
MGLNTEAWHKILRKITVKVENNALPTTSHKELWVFITTQKYFSFILTVNKIHNNNKYI